MRFLFCFWGNPVFYRGGRKRFTSCHKKLLFLLLMFYFLRFRRLVSHRDFEHSTNKKSLSLARCCCLLSFCLIPRLMIRFYFFFAFRRVGRCLYLNQDDRGFWSENLLLQLRGRIKLFFRVMGRYAGLDRERKSRKDNGFSCMVLGNRPRLSWSRAVSSCRSVNHRVHNWGPIHYRVQFIIKWLR